jgi:hypothetical protein
MSENNYGRGVTCTWHGPLTSAHSMRTIEDGLSVMMPHCPVCLGELHLVQEDEITTEMRLMDHSFAGVMAVFTWSKGKCFPDMETLENAYRQAMEE